MNGRNDMQKFKIFYSWQSDLPGNRTRNFIRECIDNAIEMAEESETIEAERDEATKGTTGSPNIVTTIFSKIDDCDLFIADVSLCFSGSVKKEKRSPNPNVLLELGYAVRTLGWERIICLCNTDFGEEYPFDISHNRITDFSLEGKSKKEVLGDVARIIFSNIRDIRKLKPIAKMGETAHIVGTYDFEKRAVIESLIPIEINKQEGYILHNKELLEEAKQLFAEIQDLTSKIQVVAIKDENLQNISSEQDDFIDGLDSIKKLTYGLMDTEIPVVWKDVEIETKAIKRWLGVEISEEFFNLGNLKQKVKGFVLCNSSPELKGTVEEKEKYKRLSVLSHKLLQLEIRADYLNTFEGMYFIPLAIQNISAMLDENIRVVVNVECGEIVEPNEHLIWHDYEGMQGYLCRNDEAEKDVGIICELFCLREDGVIHIEDDLFNPSQYIHKIPILTANGFSLPDKTEKDYANELKEFIAATNGQGYYEFEVQNLRPGECKWLCSGMLIKPINKQVKINYQIHSKYSTGVLRGELEFLLP